MTYPEKLHELLGLPWIDASNGFLRWGLPNAWVDHTADPIHLFHSPRACPFAASVYVDDDNEGVPMAVLGPITFPPDSPCVQLYALLHGA